MSRLSRNDLQPDIVDMRERSTSQSHIDDFINDESEIDLVDIVESAEDRKL